MHELSIALRILEVAEEAGRNRGGRVAAVHVRLGRLSGVVNEALASAFEMAREGTALAQAELVIEEVPLELRCPACGALTNEIVSGRELEVHTLEIES